MKEINYLVTIITPVYNRAKYIEEVILSVLNQDYPNIEYIILNDGSTDNSLEIIKKYKDRITYISHDNIGETLTVNKGFNMANGDIIGVINSDDPLYSNAVSEIVKLFLNQKDISIIYPDWNMIDENGEIIQEIVTYEYDFINMIRWHHCMPGPGTFFRKAILEVLKGRDENFKYVADFDFWLRAGLEFNFARIPKVLASFRVHNLSASIDNKGAYMANEHIELIKKLYSYHNLPKILLKYKRESYSSAFFIASSIVDKNFLFYKTYLLLKSFFLCPIKYFNEYKYRLDIIKISFSNSFKSFFKYKNARN